MNLTEFQRNRASISQELLTPFQGHWVAFSGDGRTILASRDTLDQLENQLAAQGEDPQEVFLERIGEPEDDIILRGGDLR